MIALNTGNLDRALRILVGVTLIALAAIGSLGAWAYLGLIPLATGALAWCPLYRVLGIRTTAR